MDDGGGRRRRRWHPREVARAAIVAVHRAVAGIEALGAQSGHVEGQTQFDQLHVDGPAVAQLAQQ